MMVSNRGFDSDARKARARQADPLEDKRNAPAEDAGGERLGSQIDGGKLCPSLDV